MDMEGTTALHLAAARGHDPIVHLLLLHNADVFVLDGCVREALDRKTRPPTSPISLLSHIHPSTYVSRWGYSPLAHAAANGHALVVRRLLLRIEQLQLPPRPVPLSSSSSAAAARHTPAGDVVVSPASLGAASPPAEEELEDAGAVDAVNNYGRTPLWRAACGVSLCVCRKNGKCCV
jgi:ankyrin repeat protein